MSAKTLPCRFSVGQYHFIFPANIDSWHFLHKQSQFFKPLSSPWVQALPFGEASIFWKATATTTRVPSPRASSSSWPEAAWRLLVPFLSPFCPHFSDRNSCHCNKSVHVAKDLTCIDKWEAIDFIG